MLREICFTFLLKNNRVPVYPSTMVFYDARYYIKKDSFALYTSKIHKYLNKMYLKDMVLVITYVFKSLIKNEIFQLITSSFYTF